MFEVLEESHKVDWRGAMWDQGIVGIALYACCAIELNWLFRTDIDRNRKLLSEHEQCKLKFRM